MKATMIVVLDALIYLLSGPKFRNMGNAQAAKLVDRLTTAKVQLNAATDDGTDGDTSGQSSRNTANEK